MISPQHSKPTTSVETQRPDSLVGADESKKRVLIVDDHPVFRHGIAGLLERQDDLILCGEAENPVTALELIHNHRPHLVLVDVILKLGNGIELIKEIKSQHPEVKILIVSGFDETIYAKRGLQAGASGYICKGQPQENFLVAIRQVLAGEIYLSEASRRELLTRVFLGRNGSEPSREHNLTDREFEILILYAQGISTGGIAKQLTLSVKTVNTHRANILQKLRIKTTADLIKFGVQLLERRGQFPSA